ncbi:MAG: response regulator, partial [bacterium]|nr:response regulator [bacterium]
LSEAATGQEGLRKVHDHAPDIVLLDLNMPVMDGWQLMTHVRRHPELSMIPLGIQSADEDATLPDGVAFVLRKPIDVKALLNIVRHHCG